eukprot:COSAG04_NODE_440_length_14411_cov_40.575112_5_plen_218_part_00
MLPPARPRPLRWSTLAGIAAPTWLTGAPRAGTICARWAKKSADVVEHVLGIALLPCMRIERVSATSCRAPRPRAVSATGSGAMRRGCGCRGRASRLQARSEVPRAGRRGVSHRWRVWRPRHELLAVLPRAPAHPVSRLWAQPQGSAPPRNSRSSREKSTSLWARGGPRDAQLPVGRRGCGAVGGRTPVGGRSVLCAGRNAEAAVPCRWLSEDFRELG